jgi:preprotein translocase subunit SecA
MNNQRTVVYGYRNEVLETEDPHALILEIIDESVPVRASEFIDLETGEPDPVSLLNWVNTTFPLGLKANQAKFETRDAAGNIEFLIERIRTAYELKSAHEDPEILEDLERFVILSAVDRLWQEHLYEMDGLREGIGMRAYAQKDPLIEYKTEAYQLFVDLMDRIKTEVLSGLFRTTTRPNQYQSFIRNLPQQLSRPDILAELAGGGSLCAAAQAGKGGDADGGPLQPRINIPIRRELPKVGRNDPCPCGSGKKYKQCCGKAA